MHSQSRFQPHVHPFLLLTRRHPKLRLLPLLSKSTVPPATGATTRAKRAASNSTHVASNPLRIQLRRVQRLLRNLEAWETLTDLLYPINDV
jgi:hypothetical protein